MDAKSAGDGLSALVDEDDALATLALVSFEEEAAEGAFEAEEEEAGVAASLLLVLRGDLPRASAYVLLLPPVL